MSNTGLRELLAALRRAQYDFEETAVRRELQRLLTDDALVQLGCPLDTVTGPEAFYDRAYRDLLRAIPDLERRDTILMAGPTPKADDWIGCCGYYTGTFREPWLDIPPTGHMASLRFHEFYRVVDGRVVEIQAIWDIPELMIQAGAWPLAPSLGREWHVPGPASEDGLTRPARDPDLSQRAFEIVFDMCNHLGRFAEEGVEGMRLPAFWHPRCSWYGPAGIGTCRGVEGFRNWHQIPFLNGMPNRMGNAAAGNMFADNDYVGFTAWPGMSMTISEDGWLGIPPVDREITMRSLDFWRVEGERIRENWVLVDILDVYRQIGVDVLRRMREFNKARGLAPMEP